MPEDADDQVANGVTDQEDTTTRPRLFVLSANDEHSLRKLASSYATHFESSTKLKEAAYIEKLAYTLSSRRSLLPWREAVVASSLPELAEALSSSDITPIRASEPPRLGFVFTGQGAQWAGMGIELMEAYPVFKTSILSAEKHLKSLGSDWSLVGKIALQSH